MNYVKVDIDGRPKALEVNALLSQLASLEDNREGVREQEIPLSPLVSKVDKSNNGDMTVTFTVTFPTRPFIIKQNGRSLAPGFLADVFQGENLMLKEERGLQFTYTFNRGNQAFQVGNLKFVGKRILPNIYSEKKLCFGNQRVESRGPQYLLEDVGAAIARFLGATFNRDLSECSGNTEHRRRGVLDLIEQHASDADKVELTRQFTALDGMYFNRIYTFLTLASKLNISITDVQRIL